MPVFLQPKLRKIELENNEWVEINEALPYEVVWPIISQASKNEAENLKLAVPLLTACIVSWQMFDEQGNAVTYSPDMLTKLPTPLVLQLFSECAAVFVIDKKKQEQSNELSA